MAQPPPESERKKARRNANAEDWAAAREGARIGAFFGIFAGWIMAGDLWRFSGPGWPLPVALLATAAGFLMAVFIQMGFWAMLFVFPSALGRTWRSRSRRP